MPESHNKSQRLLLISNSTLHGSGYLDHVEPELRIRSAQSNAFSSFLTLSTIAMPTRRPQERFAAMGYELDSIHEAADARKAVESTEAIFIGGGTHSGFWIVFTGQNCWFRFVVAPKRMLYIGSSAGSVVAAPTIKTTNDMPIVQPQSFASLGLVNFQINAHYLDPDPNSTHMGETREERLNQFLEENDAPVVGLREGCVIRVEQGVHRLKGQTSARIFRRGFAPVEVAPGSTIDDLIA